MTLTGRGIKASVQIYPIHILPIHILTVRIPLFLVVEHTCLLLLTVYSHAPQPAKPDLHASHRDCDIHGAKGQFSA